MDKEYSAEPPFTQEQAVWLGNVEELVDGLRDPRMDKVIRMAQAADEMMHIVPMTDQEYSRLVSDLDTEWRQWYGEPLMVQGKVSYQVTKRNGEKIVGQTVLWDQRVISKGFNIDFNGEKNEQGQRFGRVIYQFSLPADLIPEHTDDAEIIAAFALLDEIVVDSSSASKERAYSWLNTMHPDFINKVDACINTSMSEVDAVIGLSELDISEINLDDELARNCVEAYIKSQIVRDKKVPYGLIIEGDVSHDNFQIGQRIFYEVTDMKVIAKISPVRVFAQPDRSGSHIWKLGLRIKAHQRDRRIPSRRYNVPLSSIKTMVSVRDEFYRD